MLGTGVNLIRSAYTRSLSYVRDGLKLYMPYRGGSSDEVKFVGTGSTYFTTDDYIDIDVLEDDISSNTAGTISMWVKPDDGQPGSEMALIAFGDTNANEIISIELSTGGAIVVKCIDAGVEQWVTDVDSAVWADAESTWKHIALVQDGVAAIIYIDGVEVAQAFSGTTDKTDWMNTLTGIDNCRIGCSNYNSAGNAEFFAGSIKNVAIWNRALTATEVQNVMYKTYNEVGGRLASGLVSWWALDVDYTDSKGSNNGTNYGSTLNTDIYGGDTPIKPRAIDNAPTVQADAIGAGSALFDGDDDYIECGTDSSLKITGDCTIAFWVRFEDLTEHHEIISLFDYADGITIRKLDEGYGPHNFRIYRDGIHADTTFQFSGVNQWYHFAVVFDVSADKGTFYVDGILDKSVTSYNTDPAYATAGKSLKFGYDTTLDGYGGINLCQVGIWSAALTQAQIQSIMEKTYDELTASERTNLVSYWGLDVDATDSHGSNDGTLT